MSKKSVGQGILLLILLFVFVSVVYLNGCGRVQEQEYEFKTIPIASMEPEDKSVEIVIEERATPKDCFVFTEPKAPELFTEEEVELLARTIMSEAGILPIEGKIMVMAAIMNRVNSDKFPNTIKEVVTQKTWIEDHWVYQFSTQDNGDPTEECYTAIEMWGEGDYPLDMYYFRDTHYHNFGYPFKQVGNMFFSTEQEYCQKSN